MNKTENTKLNFEKEIVYSIDIKVCNIEPQGASKLGKFAIPYICTIKELNAKSGKIKELESFCDCDVIVQAIECLNELAKKQKNKSLALVHDLGYFLSFVTRAYPDAVDIAIDAENAYGRKATYSIYKNENTPLQVLRSFAPDVVFRDVESLSDKDIEEMYKDVNKYYRKETTNSKVKHKELDLSCEVEYKELDLSEKILPLGEVPKHAELRSSTDASVVLLWSYIYMIERGYSEASQLSLSFTAQAKKDRKNWIEDNYGSRECSDTGEERECKIIRNLILDKYTTREDFGFYDTCVKSQNGGLVTCLPHYIARHFYDQVFAYDAKSYYAHTMIANYFPRFHIDYTNTYKAESFGSEDYESLTHYYDENLYGLTHKELQRATRVGSDGYGKNVDGIVGYFAKIKLRDVELSHEDYPMLISFKGFEPWEYDEKSAEFVNGKLKKCKEVILSVNNVDLETIFMCYDFSSYSILELHWTTRSRQLQAPETSYYLNLFLIKEAVKDKESFERKEAKRNLSLNYGLKATAIVKNDMYYDGKSFSTVKYGKIGDRDKREEIFNKTMDAWYDEMENTPSRFYDKSFDVHSDGCYIASFARNLLVKIILEAREWGITTISTDTDSMKVFIDKKNSDSGNESLDIINDKDIITNFFNHINKKIIKGNKANDRIKEYLKKFPQSKEHEDIIYSLGTFICENFEEGEPAPFLYYSNQGSKKYVYINSEGLTTTIAGLAKDFYKCVELHAEVTGKSIIQATKDVFKDGTYIDKSIAGRFFISKEERTVEDLELLKVDGMPLLVFGNGGNVKEPTGYLISTTTNDDNILQYAEDFKRADRILGADGQLKDRYENTTTIDSSTVDEAISLRIDKIKYDTENIENNVSWEELELC